jgi:hypothetical protein
MHQPPDVFLLDQVWQAGVGGLLDLSKIFTELGGI